MNSLHRVILYHKCVCPLSRAIAATFWPRGRRALRARRPRGPNVKNFFYLRVYQNHFGVGIKVLNCYHIDILRQNPGDIFPATCVCGWFASQQHWIQENSHWFHVRPDQYWLIHPDCKMEQSPLCSIRPTSCITCMGTDPPFNHCSYVIFTSNTNEIRGESLVENIAYTCPYRIKDMATYFSFSICAYISVSIEIFRLILRIRHWKKTFLFKRCGKRGQTYS